MCKDRFSLCISHGGSRRSLRKFVDYRFLYKCSCSIEKKGNSKEEFLSPGLSYFLYITPSLGLGPAGWLNSHKHA